MIWIWRFLNRLGNFASRKIEAHDEREANRKFPPGSCVRIISGCPCSAKFVGQTGKIIRPSSMLTDWEVTIGGGDYEYICARGMERFSN